MPFPFSYTSKVEVQFDNVNHTPDNLLSNIISALKKVKVRNIQADQNCVSFSGGIFRFVINWNILVAVSRGEIVVDKINDKLLLNYHLRFTEMLVIVTAAVVGFLGPVIWQSSNLTFTPKIMILAFSCQIIP